MLVDDERLARRRRPLGRGGRPARAAGPATINALLAARLERLPDDERALLLRASVEGTIFHRGAIRELAAEWPDAVARAQSRHARPPRPDPPRSLALRRRRGLSLPASPDPRRRLPLALEGRARRSARALRRLARAHDRGPPARVRGDPRLSPRAGLPLPQRPRLRRRRADGARPRGVRAARARPVDGRSPQRPARRDRAARAGGVARRRRRRGASGAPAELGAALIEAGRLAEAETRPRRRRALAATETGDERAAARVLVQQQFLQLLHVAGGRERGRRGHRRARRPDLRAPATTSRPLQRPAARGLAALERGARGRRGEAWERAAAHAQPRRGRARARTRS